MTVFYTVPAAGSGMAALFSSGSAEITVSADFKDITDLDNPNTWPLDDQNNLVAPSSLTTLPDNISSYIKDGITGIDLSGCTNLTTIGNSAFQACASLKTVLLPESLGEIGAQAFWDCSGLENITFYSVPTKIGPDAFYGVILEDRTTPLTIHYPSSWDNGELLGRLKNELQTGGLYLSDNQFKEDSSLNTLTSFLGL